MEQEFEKIIKELMQGSIEDCQNAKAYMLLIQKVLNKIFENCQDEYSREQILEEFLEEYNKELEFRTNSSTLFYPTIQYEILKKMLFTYKTNKNKFNTIIRKAKEGTEIEAEQGESTDKKEELPSKMDMDEQMIMVIRTILRKYPHINEKDLIKILQDTKNKVSKELKDKMIKIIQECVSYIEEYGILDEYINDANEILEELGLSEIKFNKRNPIADEEYDENGNLVKDKEDIGVIDSVETKVLENQSIEDLILMTTRWQERYMDGRLGISRAMSIIGILGLWDKIIAGESIEDISEEEILKGIKKDSVLIYLCKNNIEITPDIETGYEQFIEKNGIKKGKDIKQEVEEMKPDISNLILTANDIATLKSIIMYLLQTESMPVKKWGKISDSDIIEIPENRNGEKKCVIAFENPKFRGIDIMELYEEYTETLLGKLKIPEFKNKDKINPRYLEVLLRLCMPATESYRNAVKKAYEKNPSSSLIARLAGKKCVAKAAKGADGR